MIVGKGFVWLRAIGLTVLVLLVAVPLYAMAQTALVPAADVQRSFRWIPRHVTLTAFDGMWSSVPLADYFRSSFIVAAITTVLAIAIAVPGAYALTRFAFLGRRTLAGTLLATQAVSGLLFLVPLVLLFGRADQWFGIHLLGSYAGLVLTSMTFALPVTVGLLSMHFMALPPEMEESAHDLGAGPLTTLWLVVLPNTRAAILTVAVFAFTLSWGEVLFASMLSDDHTRTLAVGLSGYASESGAHWNELMAAALLAAVPAVVVFIAGCRLLRTGLGQAAPRTGTALSGR